MFDISNDQVKIAILKILRKIELKILKIKISPATSNEEVVSVQYFNGQNVRI